MNTLQTAIASIKTNSAAVTLAVTACVAADTVNKNAAIVMSAAVAGTYESQGNYEGKAFASLGVVLLGVSTLLHLLTLLRCGGDAQHPEKPLTVRKPVHVALTVSTTV
jgi:hypothetical protein